jgi:hypothetical protein
LGTGALFCAPGPRPCGWPKKSSPEIEALKAESNPIKDPVAGTNDREEHQVALSNLNLLD